jgi:transposase
MTEEKKKGAYELLLKGYTVHEVASYYSYSDSNISLCVHKYCDENGLEFPKKTRPSFTDAQLKEIYELKKSGMSDKEIAKEYIVSRSMVEMNIKKYCKSKGLNVPVLRRGRGRRHDRTATI